MVAVIQRVSRASVFVEGNRIGAIAGGLLVLLGVAKGDSEEAARKLAEKIVGMRIFPDEHGNMNQSLVNIGGELLVVSQFTLVADTGSGRRPSFTDAASPEDGKRCYLAFVERARMLGIRTQSGEFGAMMKVDLVNDGPVTFVLRTNEIKY